MSHFSTNQTIEMKKYYCHFLRFPLVTLYSINYIQSITCRIVSHMVVLNVTVIHSKLTNFFSYRLLYLDFITLKYGNIMLRTC